MRTLGTYACCLLLACAPALWAGAAQVATAPRLRDGALPARVPEALGGGEVVLELTIDESGAVTRVDPLRATPPFTDAVATAASTWRFDPASAVVDGRTAAQPGRVLVAAIYRPATLYAGPTSGPPPETTGEPSPELPRPASLVVQAYPPTAVGDGTVLVEIAMTARGDPLDYRVLSPMSGFDDAALEAVRAWRFRAPGISGGPEPVFAYAVLGFRAPLAP